MPTPDLAGLLRRPTTSARPAPGPTDRPLAVLRNDAPAGAPPHSDQRRDPDTPTAVSDVVPGRSTPARDQAPYRRQYLRSITVYIPRSVHQQLRTTATARATTATALILAAINNTHDQLAQALTPAEEPDGHPLFDIPQVRGAGEPMVQTTIRITDRQLEAIVELTGTHGVNRSRLITTALRLYLN